MDVKKIRVNITINIYQVICALFISLYEKNNRVCFKLHKIDENNVIL